jgi:hypothetical protein
VNRDYPNCANPQAKPAVQRRKRRRRPWALVPKKAKPNRVYNNEEGDAKRPWDWEKKAKPERR